MKFDYTLNYKALDLRKNPELYRIGVGEQGVLLVEPYKSEILPYWRFKNSVAANTSSETIYKMFLNYLEQGDFVGADMARKFLQMGFTRARRYANHKSGKKYQENPHNFASKFYYRDPKNLTTEAMRNARQKILPQEQDWQDNEKAVAARIFKEKYDLAIKNELYLKLKGEHKDRYYNK
jgi:Domain of unknown function (DUF4385)